MSLAFPFPDSFNPALIVTAVIEKRFPVSLELKNPQLGIPKGSVEKSRQRRSRHFSVLTYSAYAPRVKTAVALLDGLF